MRLRSLLEGVRIMWQSRGSGSSDSTADSTGHCDIDIWVLWPRPLAVVEVCHTTGYYCNTLHQRAIGLRQSRELHLHLVQLFGEVGYQLRLAFQLRFELIDLYLSLADLLRECELRIAKLMLEQLLLLLAGRQSGLQRNDLTLVSLKLL